MQHSIHCPLVTLHYGSSFISCSQTTTAKAIWANLFLFRSTPDKTCLLMLKWSESMENLIPHNKRQTGSLLSAKESSAEENCKCASSNTSLHQCHQQTKGHECFHCGLHKQPTSSKEHSAGRDASHHTKKVAKCMAQSSSSISQKQEVNHSFPSPLRSIISLTLCHQLPIGNTSNLNIPNSSTS